ncbi:hypothetical protein, partial [Xanthomonas citri]|uniref:hypothetical protein n=1 Tax=Xanthomonas citri TaxID=346 RepID=UPI0011AF6C69
ESARNGEIPKIQTPLFGTTPPSALSGLVVQTFPREIPSWPFCQRSTWIVSPLSRLVIINLPD